MGNRPSSRVVAYEVAMSRLGTAGADAYERAYRRLAARPSGTMAPLTQSAFMRHVLAGVPDIPPALASRLFAGFDVSEGASGSGVASGADGVSLEDFIVRITQRGPSCTGLGATR
jgi:hypothetical protein